MQGSKGIAIGFVAGLVVAGGAVLLLRDEAAPRVEESAQVAELNAKLDRLERNMSQLSSQPRAQSPTPAGKRHHHHFHCRVCDAVFEVEACPGDFRSLSPRGFRVEAHELILYGRCAACSS